MSAPAPLEVNREGPRVTVTLRRAEVHNALDERLIAELHATFNALAPDEGVRVIVLAGEGRAFCAGADLNWMADAAELSEAENRNDAARLAAMLRAVAECPCPVVARIHGSVFGGGVGLVATADIAISAEATTFGFSEVRLGLLPATIAPFVIDKIGQGHARRLFLTAERFDAHEARAIGLVHRVVPEAELDAAIEEVVRTLLAGGPSAQRAAKALVRRVASADPGIDAYTSEVIAAARAGEEGREGVRAFLEKRRPTWLPPLNAG